MIMLIDVPSTTLLVSLSIAVIILLYHSYMIWFFPEKYTSDLRNGVKDWWPFSDFYRKWFASKKFLCLFRIIYSFMLIILLLFLSILFIGIIGIFP